MRTLADVRLQNPEPPIQSPGSSKKGKEKLDAQRQRDSPGPETKRRRRRKTRIGDGSRNWVFSPPNLSTHKDRFVIVSYNILGVENASKHGDLYESVDPENLMWNTRKQKICRELRCYKPSILCLQEVDRFDDLASLLQKDGFAGIYKGRTGEASDGCAIFWRENQFTLLHQENIEFQRFGLRNNVAQLCVLEMHLHCSSSECSEADPQTAKCNPCRISPTRNFIVCNIHILFNPIRGDIKLGQMRLLLEKAHRLSQEWGNSPVVIAGDFNSMPQSALYQFLSSSELDILLHDRRKISVQIECPLRHDMVNSHVENNRRYPMSNSKMKYSWSQEERLLAVGSCRDTRLQHHLKLCSAYPGVPGNCSTRDKCGEPLATSYHSKFIGTVDYIWHSQELVPVGVLDTLPINVLRKTGGLPSQRLGSDHLALVCEFAFVNDGNSCKS